MSFADQLRTAKADDEKRKQEELAKAWEDMLNEIFDMMKAQCLSSAKTGSTQTTIRLRSIYEELTGDAICIFFEPGDNWRPHGRSDSAWTKMFLNRYTYQVRPNKPDIRYCFSSEDRDSIVSGISNRCKKEGLTVTPRFKEVEEFSLAPKKVKPTGFMEKLEFASRSIEPGPDENGYYTIQARVKTGLRYEIDFCISW